MKDIARIVVVDDSEINLGVLKAILTDQGYGVRTYLSADQAYESSKVDPPDLFILDICMPEISGFELCVWLKSEPSLSEIPVIFVSALSELDDKMKAFSVGASDYITKPFFIDEVSVRVKSQLAVRSLQQNLKQENLNLQDTVYSQMEELNCSQHALITAMTRLVEARDDDTGGHIERIQETTKRLSIKLFEMNAFPDAIDEAFLQNIYNASPLHDIGKVAIPDSILLKPGKLNPEEFDVMKTHAVLGARTLESVHQAYPGNTFIHMGIEIAKYHHERWDGLGYPSGLVGESIPLSARILTVCDVYDALRSKRVYKESISHADSVRIISEGKGKQFDPLVADCFLSLEKEFNEISKIICN